MWSPDTIKANAEIVDRAVAQAIVPERTIRRSQPDWYHRFILAGVYRRLRVGRRPEARHVLWLFELPEVDRLGVSPKWLPVRVAFMAATAGRDGGPAERQGQLRRGRIDGLEHP